MDSNKKDEKQKTRNYEAILVLEKSTEEYQKAIESTFQKRNSSVTSKQEWGIRDFFHPIKHKTQGFFTYFKLTIPVDSVNLLYQDFNINTNILKCMITKI